MYVYIYIYIHTYVLIMIIVIIVIIIIIILRDTSHRVRAAFVELAALLGHSVVVAAPYTYIYIYI